MNPERFVELEAKNLNRAFNNSDEYNWSLKIRIRWLKELDRLIKESKDEILNAVGADLGMSEERKHVVLVNQYAPVRLAIKGRREFGYKVLRDESRRRFSIIWPHKQSIVRKEPLGVVGLITPSNVAFFEPMDNSIEALFAGNSVLLKPAENRERTNRLIHSLIKRSLTPFYQNNMFSILPPDIEYGKELNRKKLVGKASFVGSEKAGWHVHQINAQVRFTPVRLELGGSNPAIVLGDADIKRTARVIVWARFSDINCNSIKRVFAVQEVYDELLKEIKKRVDRLQPHEIDCNLSNIEKENYKRFLQDIGIETDKVRPIVIELESLSGDLPLMLTEETFVPILPVVKVKDEEQAIEMANNTRFGLGASIFTRDRKRFEKLARKLKCGSVNQNDAMTEAAMPHLPFGGWKSSGSGYTHGPEGLLEFVQLKVINSERWFGKFEFVSGLPLHPWTENKIKLLRKFADFLIKLG